MKNRDCITDDVTLVNVNASSIPERMYHLYTESFPPEERRKWSEVNRLADFEPRYNFYLIMFRGKAAGFITSWTLGGARYVEHFAVESSLRGNGIGLKAIKTFVNMQGAPVILEVEPAGAGDMARRRIGFYQRAGFTPHPHFAYVQPPYDPSLCEVELMLMTSSPLPLDEVAAEIHRVVYRKI